MWYTVACPGGCCLTLTMNSRRSTWVRTLGRPDPRTVDLTSGSDIDLAATARGSMAPPPAALRAGEARAPLQLLRLARAAPWLARAPRGHGELVIDLPGWKAGEASNIAMRTWLRGLGYDARAWGLGTNTGNPERDAELLVDRLRDSTRPVALIGWSLGGTIAREIARSLPEVISTVITYGSPAVGGPTYTLGASTYGREECTRITELIDRLDRDEPITVPITAVFTRSDGVVDWRACLDLRSPQVTHVEVGSTHLGLGVDPDVWWAVATALNTTSAHGGAARTDVVPQSATPDHGLRLRTPTAATTATTAADPAVSADSTVTDTGRFGS